jgi:ubiquinone/menaquinone biosynthesis C-methylase UbiE
MGNAERQDESPERGDLPARYDESVVPRYSTVFSALALPWVRTIGRATVLDFACGPGHPTFELLKHTSETTRIVAVDRNPEMIEHARRKAVAEPSRERLFFASRDLDSLRFGDGVFDVIVSNLGLDEVASADDTLSSLWRMLAPGGRIVLTRPLEGTFQEVLDMFREVGGRHGLDDLIARTELVARSYPTAEAFAEIMTRGGFDHVEQRVKRHALKFGNARQLMNDPVIEIVALADWKWIAGEGQEQRTILDEVETALDTYFGSGPVELTLHACALSARRPHRAVHA